MVQTSLTRLQKVWKMKLSTGSIEGTRSGIYKGYPYRILKPSLAGSVEGFALHKILLPYRGERHETVTCSEPILNHALVREE